MLWLNVRGAGLRVILNIGATFSAISDAARESLIQQEVLPPERLTSYTLTGVTLEGNRVGDFAVRVRGPLLARAETDGMLGLDFLRQFAQIRFDVVTFRLTLTLP